MPRSDDHRHAYELVPLDRRRAAVAFLRAWLSPRGRRELREAIKLNPTGWHELERFFWGRACRTALRQAGHGEAALGVQALDDVYVELIEDALRDA